LATKMVNSGLGAIFFSSSAKVSTGASTLPSTNSESCAPLRADITRAFQMGKLDLVSFSVIGCRAGATVGIRLEEAIGILEKDRFDTMKEWVNGGTFAVPRLRVI
jgi:hypothetical protein